MSKSYAERIAPGKTLVRLTPGTSALVKGVCKSLYVGVAGNLSVITENGDTVEDIPVLAGIFPIRCTHVLVAGATAATDIYAIY